MTRLTLDRLDRTYTAERDIRRWTAPLYEAATPTAGRGDIYNQAEQFRRRLDRAEVAAVRRIIGDWAKVRTSLDSELSRLDQLIKDGDGTDAIEQARRRLQDQRQQITRRVDSYARQVRQTVHDIHQQAADLGADATKHLVDRQLGPAAASRGITFNRLPDQAVEQMVGQLQTGPLQQVLASLGTDYVNQLGDTLTEGIARGWSPRRTARRMSELYDTPRWRALTITRTETMRAYREASRRSIETDRDVIAGTTWVAALDATTCIVCWEMHGQQFDAGYTMATHPNCRCRLVPRTKSWAELGFDGIEDPPELHVTDGDTLFRRQPAALQRQVLGPGKWQAWQDGRIDLADLVGERFDPQWGAVRFERPLRDLLT